MATPFLGELKIISWNYAPPGWAFCNGQFMPINQNQALFSLLGTTYGGNGQTTFALPDFRGRVPIHFGSGHIIGERGGEEAHTLTLAEMPTHIHLMNANAGNAATPLATGNFLAATSSLYTAPTSPKTLLPQTITNVGGSQPHENRQPFLTLHIIIALEGIFPSRN